MLVCYAIVFCFCIAELGWWFGNLSDSVIFFIMNALQFVIFYTNFVSALYSGVSGEGSLVATPPTADTKASIFPMIKCGWLISCFLFTLCALTHGWFIFVTYSLYCLWTLYCPLPWPYIPLCEGIDFVLIPFSTAGKSSVMLDVKPWDDETDMKKLEEAVRSIEMEGLLFGACMFLLAFCTCFELCQLFSFWSIS